MGKKQQKHMASLVERIVSVVLVVGVITMLGASGVLGPENQFFAAAYYSKGAESAKLPEADTREPIRTMWVVSTAYSSEVAQTDSTPCIPADGSDLCVAYEEFGIRNAIAANFLPLGTIVKFPEVHGDKPFIVRDRMNARYNGTNRIDFWMPNREEAVNHGIQYMKMEIY